MQKCQELDAPQRDRWYDSLYFFRCFYPAKRHIFEVYTNDISFIHKTRFSSASDWVEFIHWNGVSLCVRQSVCVYVFVFIYFSFLQKSAIIQVTNSLCIFQWDHQSWIIFFCMFCFIFVNLSLNRVLLYAPMNMVLKT